MKLLLEKVLLCVLVCVLAPSAVGYVTGYMTGYSQINKDILVIILPSLVSLAGFILISGIRVNATTESRAIASGGMFVLCVALFIGLSIGVEKQKSENSFILRYIEIKKRENILRECSRSQNELNKVRTELGQSPVPLDEICP